MGTFRFVHSLDISMCLKFKEYYNNSKTEHLLFAVYCIKGHGTRVIDSTEVMTGLTFKFGPKHHHNKVSVHMFKASYMRSSS